MLKDKNRLRVGILGCGPISQFAHLESAQKARNILLRAVCDADESLAQQFGQFYGAERIYLDYDDMLADPSVDAIIIATSDPFHVPAALKALSAGKHVLCEKPLGISVEEVELLAQKVQAEWPCTPGGSHAPLRSRHRSNAQLHTQRDGTDAGLESLVL